MDHEPHPRESGFEPGNDSLGWGRGEGHFLHERTEMLDASRSRMELLNEMRNQVEGLTCLGQPTIVFVLFFFERLPYGVLIFESICIVFCIECSPTQPVAAQVFHACGERQRGSLDCGRSGVLQASASAL